MANRRERRQGQRQRRKKRIQRKLQRARGSSTDFISSMPDDILHHILSFTPTESAVSSCILSRRWRYVWCETPSLRINDRRMNPEGMKQTLTSYKAPKITSLYLSMSLEETHAPQIDSWIELAVSRNVQKLFVTIHKTYSFPDLFYHSSSVKQLSVRLSCFDMIPTCTVSWKSLRNLSLIQCKIRDESMDNILSGCPILESLTLSACRLLERLDLSNSLSLRRLDIDRFTSGEIDPSPSGPVEIIAPHIHYLRLRIHTDKPCTLVDVSSLTEASLEISIDLFTRLEHDFHFSQTMALEMLAKVKNVERLTLMETFLQILSLAGIFGFPFPTLKVQTLIVSMERPRVVIPGLERLLHNSPGLKMLSDNMMNMHLGSFLDPNRDRRRWSTNYYVFPTKETYSTLGCNDVTSKLLASFVELVLRNAKTLETMVVRFGGPYFKDAQWFQELLQIVGTLSRDNNVSIVLKSDF